MGLSRYYFGVKVRNLRTKQDNIINSRGVQLTHFGVEEKQDRLIDLQVSHAFQL